MLKNIFLKKIIGINLVSFHIEKEEIIWKDL